MKNRVFIIGVIICIAINLTGCSGRNAPRDSASAVITESSQADQGVSESDYAEEIPPSGFDETAEKYYDYMDRNNYISMILSDEKGSEGFTDAQMAAYAISELIILSDGAYDHAVGFPKEEIDAITKKYFGTTIRNYENRMSTVIPSTGNITATGWGGNPIALVLKELEIDSDGVCTGVFYQLRFSLDEIKPSMKSDLLQGSFDGYGQPFLITIVFEEKTDENGEMYLRYHDVKPEGEANPPYQIFHGEPVRTPAEEDDPEQPDPTLPENQAGSFYRWDHVEYRKFGDISAYHGVALELHDYAAENAGKQAAIINAVMRLPLCCLIDEYGGVIEYDGNFANGTIKIGGPPGAYYRLRDGETIRDNSSDSYSFDVHTANPLSGEKYEMAETQENRVGGYYQTQKFMRYIGQAIGPVETHLLQYVIDLGDGYLTDLYFFVSPKATAKDLEIYDAIADSVEIVK